MAQVGRRCLRAVVPFVLLAVAAIVLLRARGPNAVAPIAVPPGPAVESLDVADLRASRGIPLRAGAPPAPPMTEGPLTLRVEPARPEPPPMADLPQAGTGADAPPIDPKAPLEIAASAGAAGGEGRVDPFLRLRVYVQPEVPSRVVAKRRIDDAVTVQVRVGVDGRAMDVRVLDDIPGCPECTRNATAAAWRLVYDAPVGGPVWAAPVKMQFHHNRGR